VNGAATIDPEEVRKNVADAGKQHYAAAMAGDVETLDLMIGDDVLYTHTNGRAEDKASYLDRVARGTYSRMSTIHSADHIWVLSDDVAVVRGTTHSTTTGNGGFTMDNLECAVLDVWVNRDSRWQLIAHHISLVLEDAAVGKVLAVASGA
jgi:ketosteroid isomerase-like protein